MKIIINEKEDVADLRFHRFFGVFPSSRKFSKQRRLWKVANAEETQIVMPVMPRYTKGMLRCNTESDTSFAYVLVEIPAGLYRFPCQKQWLSLSIPHTLITIPFQIGQIPFGGTYSKLLESYMTGYSLKYPLRSLDDNLYASPFSHTSNYLCLGHSMTRRHSISESLNPDEFMYQTTKLMIHLFFNTDNSRFRNSIYAFDDEKMNYDLWMRRSVADPQYGLKHNWKNLKIPVYDGIHLFTFNKSKTLSQIVWSFS